MALSDSGNNHFEAEGSPEPPPTLPGMRDFLPPMRSAPDLRPYSDFNGASGWPGSSSSKQTLRLFSAHTPGETDPFRYTTSQVSSGRQSPPPILPPLSLQPPPNTRKRASSTQEIALEEEPSTPTAAPAKEVKNTKRAQQNRLAQRNFRERKEAHVKELERKAALLAQLQSQHSEFERARASLHERELALARVRDMTGEGIAAHQQVVYEQTIQELRGEIDALQKLRRADEQRRLLDSESPTTTTVSPASTVLSNASEVEHLRRLLSEARTEMMDRDNRLDSMRRAVEELSLDNRKLRQQALSDSGMKFLED